MELKELVYERYKQQKFTNSTGFLKIVMKVFFVTMSVNVNTLPDTPQVNPYAHFVPDNFNYSLGNSAATQQKW